MRIVLVNTENRSHKMQNRKKTIQAVPPQDQEKGMRLLNGSLRRLQRHDEDAGIYTEYVALFIYSSSRSDAALQMELPSDS